MDIASRILQSIEINQTQECLGVRQTDIYSWQTYENVGKNIKNLSNGLRRLLQPQDYVGICARNRPEWIIADFACLIQSLITVPIYTELNDQDTTYIINNTSLSAVICDLERLPKFLRLAPTCPSLRHVICMDPTLERTDQLSVHSMSDIEADGSMMEFDYCVNTPDRCITIVYTSGSSGMPKGAQLTEKAFRALFPADPTGSDRERVTFCYRSLAWITDRKAILSTFLRGGSIGFASGNLSQLMEELLLVSPTHFSAPPTFWNKIYSEFQTALSFGQVDSCLSASLALPS